MSNITRRGLLLGATTLATTAVLLSNSSFAAFAQNAITKQFSVPLPIPPLVTPKDGEEVVLTMKKARHNFDPKNGNKTALSAGINADYLGPTIKLNNGQSVKMKVENRLGEVTTLHWHGLFIPSHQDGGPHNLIEDGKDWNVALKIDQPASLNWYHPHVHQDTARQAHMGLAGLMIIDDNKDESRGLPHQYGIDDFPLVLQDRRVIEGDHVYQPDMMDLMHGFRGDKLIVNGVMNPYLKVPQGIVRLRLLNGANARVYTLSFSDKRDFSVIASDGGYIPSPSTLNQLTISPGERYEILVDFSDKTPVTLQTSEFDEGSGRMLPLMAFTPNKNDNTQTVQSLPKALDPLEKADKALGLKKRSFFFDERMKQNMVAMMAPMSHDQKQGMSHDMPEMKMDMNMDHSQHGGKSAANSGHATSAKQSGMAMAIAGETFDMSRVDVEAKLGSYELWTLTADEMAHPFHIHGASFRVISKDGKEPPAHEAGWKDTVLVNKTAEVLVYFNRDADKKVPFMFHCHVLEHEDLGMMAQFITI